MGRIRDAWRAYRGKASTSPMTRADAQELRAEWDVHRMEMTSMFEKLNAWAARQAKRDSRAVGLLDRRNGDDRDSDDDGDCVDCPDEATQAPMQGQPNGMAMTPAERKAQLRSRYAQGRLR